MPRELVIREPMDREWKNEVLRFPMKNLQQRGAKALAVCRAGTREPVPAQVAVGEDGMQALLVYVDRLGAGETLRLIVGRAAANMDAPGAVYCRREGDKLLLGGSGFAVELPTEMRLGPPLLAWKGVDGRWRGQSRFEHMPPLTKFTSRIIAAGPVWAAADLTCDFGGQKHLTVRVSAKMGLNAVEVREDFYGTARGAYALDLAADFAPDMVYRRCHTPSVGRGGNCEVGENAFSIDWNIPGNYLLQPYHAWHLDAATWWSCYEAQGGRDLLGLVMLHTDYWRRGQQNQVEVTTPPPRGVEARFRLAEGRRWWAMYFGNKETDFTADTHKAAGAVHRAQIKMGHMSLQKALEWNLGWYEARPLVRFPRVFISGAELAARRRAAVKNVAWRKFAKDARAQIRQARQAKGQPLTIFDHWGREEIGLALAGEKIAPIALRAYAESMLQSLEESVDNFLQHGYTDHRNVALIWSRWARDRVVLFDALAALKAFTPAELRRAMKCWNFLGHITADPDYWPREETDFHRGNPNFHTDMISAEALMMGLLVDHPDAESWRKHCENEFRKEFAMAIGPGGVWYECPLYTYGTLWWTMQGMAAIRHAGGVNLFEDERFQRCMETLCDMQTPPDPRVGGGIGLVPVVGNTHIEVGVSMHQCILAWAAGQYGRNNPTLAVKLAEAWKRGGSFVGGRGMAAVLGLELGLPHVRPKPFEAKSRALPEFGALLRHGDTYVLYKHGPHYQHYDADEGSFSWYWKGIPLCVDWGSQYHPNFGQPWYHNRVSLAHREEGERGQVVWFRSKPAFDYVVGRTLALTDRAMPETAEEKSKIPWQRFPKFQPLAAPVSWTRHLYLIKGPDVLVIWDDLQGGTWSDWNLWTLATTARQVNERTFFLEGMFDADLTVFFARPFESFQLGEDGWENKGLNVEERLRLVRVKAPNTTGFLVALAPNRKGQPPPKFRLEEGADVFQVQTEGLSYEVCLTTDKPEGIQDLNDLHWLGLRRYLRAQEI